MNFLRRVSGERSRAAAALLAYLGVTVALVLALGQFLWQGVRSNDNKRGEQEAARVAAVYRSEALAPLLGSGSLDNLPRPVSMRVQAALDRAVADRTFVRARLRDGAGEIVAGDTLSMSRTTRTAEPDDEVADALRGKTVTVLTRLNSDTGDLGPLGARVAEVYQPLIRAGQVVGVFEAYLSYDPIAAAAAGSRRSLADRTWISLGVLWVALALMSVSMTRRLRHQLAANELLANHDPLTGLANRRLFETTAREALARRRRSRMALVLLDVDQFKTVNDTRGHDAGDALLVTVADSLRRLVRAGDLVARLGGDEFAILLTRLASPEDAADTAERIQRGLGAALSSSLHLPVSASAGFALAPDDAADLPTLLRLADVAMYAAKRAGTGCARYEADRDGQATEAFDIAEELAAALDRDGELQLWFQPKLTLDDGRIASVEALIRWRHPARGVLLPGAFLAVAESNGLGLRLTAWVVAEAVSALSRWSVEHPELAVAVNVSPQVVLADGFEMTVLAALAKAGVHPRRLLLEITETSLINDPERAHDVLSRLASAGVRISIDDFGSGFAGLGHLTVLPVDELKIDRAYVAGMLDNPVHAAIVRSVLGLGRSLGVSVVAEGVETVETATELQRWGCDAIQGYYIAKPLPEPDLLAMLASHESSQASSL